MHPAQQQPLMRPAAHAAAQVVDGHAVDPPHRRVHGRDQGPPLVGAAERLRHSIARSLRVAADDQQRPRQRLPLGVVNPAKSRPSLAIAPPSHGTPWTPWSGGSPSGASCRGRGTRGSSSMRRSLLRSRSLPATAAGRSRRTGHDLRPSRSHPWRPGVPPLPEPRGTRPHRISSTVSGVTSRFTVPFRIDVCNAS